MKTLRSGKPYQFIQEGPLPSWEHLKIFFLFPRWNMLVPGNQGDFGGISLCQLRWFHWQKHSRSKGFVHAQRGDHLQKALELGFKANVS